MGVSNKINPIQLAKLQAILFGLIGLCLGIYYSIGGMFVDILVSAEVLQAENWDTPGLSIGTIMAYMALVAMPLFAALCGFALGLVEGLLYNLFRKWLGRFDFKLFD